MAAPINTIYTRAATWTCTAAVRDAANKAVDPVSGQSIQQINNGDLFVVPLSATGKQPDTHYWGSWVMTQAEYDAVRRALDSLILAGSVTEDQREEDQRVGTKKTAQQAISAKGLVSVTMDATGKPLDALLNAEAIVDAP